MGLLIFYLVLALALSFLCSVLEAVILSVTMPFIETKEKEGSLSAKVLKKQKLKIDQPLSAILSVNTIAHTVGAAGVGAQAVAVFGETYFGIISAILTLLILVVSEIIPKTIGAIYWRQLAQASARILQGMIIVSYPLVKVAEFLTKMISGKGEKQTISRREVAALAHLGMQEGVIEESESRIIDNLIRLKSFKIKSILTPRTVVVAAKEELNISGFLKNRDFFKYSRIPIYQEDKDNITGYVLKYEVLEKLANDEFSIRLKDIKRPILVVYENQTIPDLFDQLLDKREHIALVVDEYGGMEGIVTMEDIIETILGLEIVDETDKQADMQQVAKERWKIRFRRLKNDYNK